MQYVVGYMFVCFGLYVHIMNIRIAINAGKVRAIDEKKYSPSGVILFDFLPIVIGLPFITNFSYSMNTYIFISLPLVLGLLMLETLAYWITFRINKRKKFTPKEGDLC